VYVVAVGTMGIEIGGKGACGMREETRTVYKFVVGKLEKGEG
jgi:hypothetical protein